MEETDRVIARMTNSLKRQNELKRRNSVVARLVDIMRYNGASEQSIQKALPAFEEFAKYSKMLPGYLALDEQSDKPDALVPPAQTAQSDPQEEKPEPGNRPASPDTGQIAA